MTPVASLGARVTGDVRASDADRAACVERLRDALHEGRLGVRHHALWFTGVNGGLVGVWVATGEGVFWPGGVLAPWAVVLAGHVMARRGARAVRARLPR